MISFHGVLTYLLLHTVVVGSDVVSHCNFFNQTWAQLPVRVKIMNISVFYHKHSYYYKTCSFSICSSILSEDSLSITGSVYGKSFCCSPMSAVRRTFCLLLLFDFILTFILWVIHVQVSLSNMTLLLLVFYFQTMVNGKDIFLSEAMLQNFKKS